LPAEPAARIRVQPDSVERSVSPTMVGINLNPGAPRATLIADPVVLRRVKTLGLRTVRFPNGCVADQYNWKQPPAGQVTVEQFLEFCDEIDAEPYYTLNLQGGTEGLADAPAKDAPPTERIRHRHTAPNPCGDVNYHFGTLAEALELLERHTIQRALAGRRPITCFELGNENWGQSTTDWPPDVYGKTCEAYANAMRMALREAAAKHPELQRLYLYIVAVGYPTMGNNQDAFKATNREINIAWTAEMNRLADLKLIDAVQEHFYPYGNADGSTLLWTVHNLNNILCLRHGVANPRLGGYRDPALAYRLPMEWTEWNVKCWGALPAVNLPLANPGFEAGPSGWIVDAGGERGGEARFDKSAARRGGRGLKLTARTERPVEVRQPIPVRDRRPAAGFGAAVWVRTSRPDRTQVVLRQADEVAGKGAVLGVARPTRAGTWERLVASGPPRPETAAIEVALQVTGPDVEACFDEVQPVHWATFSGVAPMVADRFEQQLFLVDALRILLSWPTPRSHLHHLFGNYPCGVLTQEGADRNSAASFRFFNQRIGDRVIRTTCDCPVFDYDTAADKYATDFNALAPDMSDVPVVSVLATRDDRYLYILLVNRTSDRPVRAELAFGGTPLSATGDVRTLAGADFDTTGATVRSGTLAVADPLRHVVPPHCAQVLRLGLPDRK
jgi:alpha-L-arabinofuranosidase